MIDNDFYGPSHRELQERFDTVRLANFLEMHAAIDLDAGRVAFLEAASMFFLSTVDHAGRPTVSYKGGAPGFVTVVDPTTLLFPSYDGNGMYLSMGNLSANPAIGMLFISFERPQRLRIQGNASISTRMEDLDRYPEAEMVVRVDITDVFTNCPRYVHRATNLEVSRYVPQDDVETPFAEWKRMDVFAGVLRPDDAAKASALGPVDPHDWHKRVESGHPVV
jgi:uncharacterized protein